MDQFSRSTNYCLHLTLLIIRNLFDLLFIVHIVQHLQLVSFATLLLLLRLF